MAQAQPEFPLSSLLQMRAGMCEQTDPPPQEGAAEIKSRASSPCPTFSGTHWMPTVLTASPQNTRTLGGRLEGEMGDENPGVPCTHLLGPD